MVIVRGASRSKSTRRGSQSSSLAVAPVSSRFIQTSGYTLILWPAE